MAAPPVKPWERPGVNYNTLTNPTQTFPRSSSNQFINDGQMHNVAHSGPGLAGNVPQNPPPLPPRPNALQPTGLGGGYGSSYFNGAGAGGGYGYSPYSSMFSSPYSMSYGGGGYGMNRYGGYSNYGQYSGPFQNSFIQMAEDSSRPAFQSIEAIVHAVSSVSMMMESTYNALYSSFRAVLGVAHHFSNMKTQLTQILSALAIIRSLRWLYRKILYMIGIRKINPLDDEVWSTVSNSLNDSKLAEGDIKRGRSNWPIVMFFVVIFGAPWLIWKLLVSMTGNTEAEVKKWMVGEGPHYVGVALYSFRGETQNELSFTAKQTMRIAPKELQPRLRGWLMASVDGKTSGLIPANYVKIYASQPNQTPSPTQNTPSQTNPPPPYPVVENKEGPLPDDITTNIQDPSMDL